MYYRICPHCDAHLDPGEVCDCQAKSEETTQLQQEHFHAKKPTPTVNLAKALPKGESPKRYGHG